MPGPGAPFPNGTTVYTIGHSNRSLAEFVDLLRNSNIHSLVDVRSYPKSRRNPHFSSEPLRASLEQQCIAYHWAGKTLGGMRKSTGSSRHIALSEEHLRAYADLMETSNFTDSVKQVLYLAEQSRTVIMCAEKLPEHCHRNFIADFLTSQHVRVHHLISINKIRQHVMNTLARVEKNRLIYDRHTSGELDLSTDSLIE